MSAAAGRAALRRPTRPDFAALVAEVVAATERGAAGGVALSRGWDVEGDPRAMLLAGLWAHVADGVAAYTELTAGESYLDTAADWSDLRRLAALVGHRPRARVAAQGWVRVEVDAASDPLVPAGTRMQAPAAPPARPAAQAFETVDDTQLRADWGGLSATWVPQRVALEPGARAVRFRGDPGYSVGDLILFVRQEPARPPLVPASGRSGPNFDKLIAAVTEAAARSVVPLALARVQARAAGLGTTLLTFDRDLARVLAGSTKPYAAWRVTASAGSARQLSKVLSISGTTVTPVVLSTNRSYDVVRDTEVRSMWITLDAALEDLSSGLTVAVVDWASPAADVLALGRHVPVSWEVAPGTPVRASQLVFEATPGAVTLMTTLADQLTGTTSPPDGAPRTVYVVDRRADAAHVAFPIAGGPADRLRLWPPPAVVPSHLAVRTVAGWEVTACSEAAPTDAGMAVVLASPLSGDLEDGGTRARASANLVRVRQGATVTTPLGRGDGQAGQVLVVPDAPVTSDLDAGGNPVSSLVLRVDGRAWRERSSLYGAGPAEAFTARLDAGGGVGLEFGDGVAGARLPAGATVEATYRVGGGVAGEVGDEAIDGLIGSIRGVRRVAGAGATSGGADQDGEASIRRLAPLRATVFGRAVSLGDLVDLARTYPGVSHAAAWQGGGPPGCACGGIGLHLAFLRAGVGGARNPGTAEVAQLAAFLDGRRDVAVALCVAAGSVVEVDVLAQIIVDRYHFDGAAVLSEATTAVVALGRPEGRAMGQPLDATEVVVALHGVRGVVGVGELSLAAPGRRAAPDRLAAASHELLTVVVNPAVGVK